LLTKNTAHIRWLLAGAVSLAACGFHASAVETSLSPEESEDDLRLSQVVQELRSRSDAELAAVDGSREEALALLLGGRPYPGGCATPLMIGLAQVSPALDERARASVRSLGLSPRGASEMVLHFQSGASTFRLHFATTPGMPGALNPADGDLDGVPDEARLILSRIQQAHTDVAAALDRGGLPGAALDPAKVTSEIEVTDLPGRMAGYVLPASGGPALVLDRDSIVSPDGPRILRHQMTHLYQIALTADESPWWYEAHAIWMEDPGGERAAERATSVAAYLRTSRSGLEPDLISAWEGSFLWPHYILSNGGAPYLLSFAWEEMAAIQGNNTLAAFESALARGKGSSLADEVRAFRIWNLFTGDADDGNHYPFGADLPVVQPPSVREVKASSRALGPIAPLGGVALRLVAGPGPGGWKLDFDGISGVGWDVTMLTVPAGLEEPLRLAEVRLEEGSHGSSAIPWQDLAAVVVVVQNLGGERRETATCSLTAVYDPVVPFDLMSFTADLEGRAAAVRWSTEGEMNLAGWQVYRSRSPLSGFVPITSIPVPATGEREAASYLFLDTDLRPGRKYYYLLEAVTRDGFTARTHLAAVRVPAAGPAAPR